MIPFEEKSINVVKSGKSAQIGLWKSPKKQDIEHALPILETVEASHLANRQWGVLSQGERQRILIARALAASPRILILDEPCAGLDPIAREHFLAFLSRLTASPKSPSLVLVSHHVEEIIPSITHALLLKNGQVHSQGLLSQTLNTQTLSSLFDSTVTLRKSNARYTLSVR